MTGWHDGRLVCFDLETTSADPETARIVSACVAAVGGVEAPMIREWLVNPGVDIPGEATAVHGITTDRARDHGMPPGQAVAEIKTCLVDAWQAGHPVVIFNATYDLTVLDRESHRHHGWGFDVTGPVLDPYVIDREIDKYRRGSRSLSAQVEHYQVRLDGAHDATQDALAAGRVLWRIATRYPAIRDAPLEDLQPLQVAWHRERQADFANYLRRQGKPADDVCGDWPIRVFAGAAS